MRNSSSSKKRNYKYTHCTHIAAHIESGVVVAVVAPEKTSDLWCTAAAVPRIFEYEVVYCIAGCIGSYDAAATATNIGTVTTRLDSIWIDICNKDKKTKNLHFFFSLVSGGVFLFLKWWDVDDDVFICCCLLRRRRWWPPRDEEEK